ncbi:hypothetical protein [Pseudonocardia sp. GCM10023141]|uniref:hypothetical protein n=1 Tax=Pseudonocardia sp. GCM10023141 TaxID=3252653 RepID=UPI00360C64E7
MARGAAEPPVLTVSATGVAPPRTGRAEQAPYVPPPGGAGVRGTERTHRRPDYLITPDAFADDRVVAPAVIVPDDLEESRG